MKGCKFLFFFLLIFVLAGCSEENPVTFDIDRITIITPQNEKLEFEVEMALTREQQKQGLMHRKKLATNSGMLFIFPQAYELSFWMKNTLIPLDTLFIDESGRINRIHSMAKPHDTTSIKSGEPAKAALEINGGLAEKLGITEGSMVIHPAFDKTR